MYIVASYINKNCLTDVSTLNSDHQINLFLLPTYQSPNVLLLLNKMENIKKKKISD